MRKLRFIYVLALFVCFCLANPVLALTAVHDCTELQNIKNDLSESYYLANDIDCSATSTWNRNGTVYLGFEPIGNSSSSYRFTGSLDGRGHTISGLYINRSLESYVGLFGYAYGAEIYNLSLTGAKINGNSSVGGIAGYASSTTITNVSVSVSLNAHSYYAGGIAGNGGLIKQSSVSGNIVCGKSSCGGISGREGLINRSYFKGNVSGYSNVGGLIGYRGSIYDSYAEGNVSGYSEVGGLIGSDGSIYDSYAECNVTGSSYYVGGLIGYMNTGNRIYRSFSKGVVKGAGYVGGAVGYAYAYSSSPSIRVEIHDSYSTSNVTGSSYVGGFIGSFSWYIYIYNSYSTGYVYGTGSDIGGFAGSGYSSCYNSFWDIDTSGQSSSDCGIGLSDLDMKRDFEFSLNSWNFDSVWDIDCGHDYPHLQWENTPRHLCFNLSGSGTSSDPYEIDSCNDLEEISGKPSAYYELTSSIDCSGYDSGDGKGFMPVRHRSPYFTGTLNGNGHTISGLYINRSSENYVGLFGRTSGAEIYNLSLTGAKINGNRYVGSIAGYASSTSISNVNVSASLDAQGDYAGGIAGYGGSINQSYFKGNVTGSSNYVGGLIGYLYDGNKIYRSFSKGIVKGAIYVGGAVGYARGSSYPNFVEIYDSYSTSNVTGSSYVGGFIGHLDENGLINRSYSTGYVNGTGSYVGGFAGRGWYCYNSFWDIDTSGQSSSSCGTGLSDLEMKKEFEFSARTWDFSNVWDIDCGYDYPRLQWENTPRNLCFNLSGSGTSSDPYEIASCNDLEEITGKPSAYFELTSPIDCSGYDYGDGKGFMPVCRHLPNFSGTLDGKGHTISGLYINRSSENYVGLFGSTSGASIYNLSLTGAKINGNSSVGGIAGYAFSTTITNVNVSVSLNAHNFYGGGIAGSGGLIKQSSVSGNIVCSNYYCGGISGRYGVINRSYFKGNVSGSFDVGGLIGGQGSIYDSYVEGNVTGSSNYVGGLIGYLYDGNKIYRSFSKGVVKGLRYVGGAVGEAYSYSFSHPAEINDSYSMSNVTGSSYVGGFIGYLGQYSFINRSYSTGYVYGTLSCVGGFVGERYSGFNSCNNSFFDNETSGMSGSSCGTPKSTRSMKKQQTFENAGWDFDNVWGMNPYKNSGYPFLRWQNITVILPIYTNFISFPHTTNLSAVPDLTDVTNLTLETLFGMLQFPHNHSVNVAGQNLDDNIIFGDCYVAVNTSALDYTFNATAYLTLNNSDGHCGDDRIYYAPGVYDSADAIRQHDTVCSDCIKLIADNHMVKFRVYHFSSYAIGSNANLTIYDSYENSAAQPNADIIFYANYTNKSGSHISGGTCTIYFDGNTNDKHNMTDNGNNYNYTYSFSSTGTHNYNITCSATNYNTLSAVDDVNVESGVVPEFGKTSIALLILLLTFGIFVVRYSGK